MKRIDNGLDVVFCQECLNEYKGRHGEIKKTIMTGIKRFSVGHVEGHIGKINDLTVVVFCGSYGDKDWIDNLQFFKEGVSTNYFGRFCTVHTGFFRQFELIKSTVFELIKDDKKIVVTGHSLGGAIATLFAACIAKHMGSRAQIGCVTFGSPRVGDRSFKKAYDRLVPLTKRYVYGEDMVCKVPPSLRWWYVHVGNKIRLGKMTWKKFLLFIPRKIFGDPMDHKPEKYLKALKERYESSHT